MAKRKSKTDPYAVREQEKYEHPIKSREYILAQLAERDGLVGFAELATALEITDEAGLAALRKRLRAMERDGQVVCNRRGAYGIAARMDLVRGRVIGHPDGYGFLVPDDGGDDLFLSAREMRAVLHGDRVIAKVVGVDRRQRREGALVEVLERNTHELVGRYYEEGGVGFVDASNKRINQEVIVPRELRGAAAAGQIVVAAIVEQPTRHSQPVGKIVEVLGDHMAPGMEVEIAIRSHGLPHEWPAEVEQEIAAMPTEVEPHSWEGREDLRALPLVTIDGEDAQDFDDAVFCERKGRGWRLVVAIADVASYVRSGTALDREARLRGNSVYFPQHVIPMLPELLSNHLCSLRPAVERLCFVCELSITPAGRIRGYRFFDAVMRSQARLTYNQVAAMLVEHDAALCAEHGTLLPHLQALEELYRVLRRAREQRGAVDFERLETRIVFGLQRKIRKIVPVVRNDAHRMIEEFMIAANIAAAELLLERGMPAVYRIHPEPDPDKVADVRAFLGELGLRLEGSARPAAQDYARLIAAVAERPDRHLIETVLLRSLAQAIYSPDNIGHFGLALEAYAHFTSPIRRYPDLMVHRAIRHALAGRSAATFRYGAIQMQDLGDHCSMTERRADEATRDAVDWLKCEYMLSHVGKEFAGIVTGVTSFGLFVELDEIYVEGLVHVTALDNDYYHFDPVKHLLYGEHTGITYRLADRVRVLVARVDLDERTIDFTPVAEHAPHAGRKRAAAPRAARPRRKKERTGRGRR